MILFKCVLSSRDTLHPVEKRQGKEQRTIFEEMIYQESFSF